MNHSTTLLIGRFGLAAVLVVTTLTACGQKGNLYLPDANTAVVSPKPTPTDDSTQPTVSANPQNPNVTSTDPTAPATTATNQGNPNDY